MDAALLSDLLKLAELLLRLEGGDAAKQPRGDFDAVSFAAALAELTGQEPPTIH